ncbi:MAG: hypothetical protein LBT26_04825, partial [Clostridiales Family XIII bacterium]|nr:hypothetical protein [Clostridiales Family XIII bacterium]
MDLDFGVERVIEPTWAIPVAAWRLDNSRDLRGKEMRVRIRNIKLEEASFRQLCSECDYDALKIKEKIFDIIKKRGKIHNPATGSGGIFYGEVDEIGKQYARRDEFKPGDPVICITSLSAIPLHLDSIADIDFNYGQITAEGYAILSGTNPVVHYSPDLALPYTMAAMEEASSLHQVFQLASGTEGGRFLILSSDILSATLYGALLRKAADGARIVAALDQKSVENLPWQEIKRVLGAYIDEIYILDILAPLKSFEEILEKEERLFDFCINCADLMGAEAVGVLLTEQRGTMLFTSFINNHGLALLFAESLGKELNTYSLDAYTEGFRDFTIAFLREIKPNLEQIHKIYRKHRLARRRPADSKT